ncbi:amino acid adenylation domain-containing protein [Paenibacillus terreus]|uniref:Amino acid adenylation domain-containing protein n=1 Tax=Paenibacillus terreus TaxID=1387834 RepID=A0ABV5B2Q6_9BACL
MSTSFISNHYVFPASFAQRRIWFVQETISDPSVYHVPLLYKLHGPVQMELLQQSVNKLVERHESLRTYFAMEDNEIVQVIVPELDCVIDHVQIHAEAVMQVQGRMMDEIRRPFSLEQAPLFRMILYSINPHDHYLLINMHHIITDGWSYSVFMRELSMLYSAALREEEAELPELPIQVADFSQWQKENLQGGLLEKQLCFWEKHLEGELPVLDLPTNPSRPSVIDNTGASFDFTVPLELSQRFAQLCSSSGMTLYIGLLAVYQVLLARYSGQDDIITGTPIANRHHDQLENVIGMFVNTVVLRSRLRHNPTFRDMLRELRMTAIEAYEHQDTPFEMLVERLSPERNLGQTPVFQAMFAFQNHPKLELELPHVHITPVELDLGTAKFELYLDITETAKGLLGVFEYQKQLYDHNLIEQLSVHFIGLLESILEDPDQRVWHIPFISEQEKQSLLDRLHHQSNIALHWQGDECCHQRFERVATNAPDAAAVSCNGQTLTYFELNQNANQIAWHLRKNGIGPGSAVGIWLSPSLDFVLSILAIWKAGGCYVALNPDYPVEKNSSTLQAADLSYILTNQMNQRDIPEGDHTVICLEQLGPVGESDSNPYSPAAPHHAAYQIYTTDASGSHQAVSVPHYRLMKRFEAAAGEFGYQISDVWTLLHSPDSGLAVWEMLCPLLSGGKLVIVPNWIAKTPKYLHELLIKEKVSILTLTNASFFSWVALDEINIKDKLYLRTVFVKGKMLAAPPLDDWFKRHAHSHPELIQMYSSDELGGPVGYRTIHAHGDNGGRQNRRIDVPAGGLAIYIVDANGEFVPAGVAGTLYVGEPDTGSAKLFHTKLKDGRWSYHTVNQDRGVWLYRTDDIGRLLQNGEIEYLRSSGGHAELGEFYARLEEIRRACIQHGFIREAAIRAVRDEHEVEQLTAYLVAEADQDVSVQEVQAYLRNKLPEHMIPSTMHWVESLPRQEDGEIDYKLLRRQTEHKAKQRSYSPPSNWMEETLAGIWERSLELLKVGVDDNYFVCGGDSIRMLSMIALARECNLHFDIRDLLSHQTIRELAPHVKMVQQTSQAPEEKFDLVPDTDRAKLPRDVTDAYPLTQLQNGMLFHSELYPESRLYHDMLRFSIHAPFQKDVWENALRKLVSRHPILRTTFDLSGYSIPLQLVHEAGELQLKYFQLSGLNPERHQEWIQDWVEEELDTPFDWSHSLFRVYIHQLADDWIQLFAVFHHSLLDGWSVNLIMVELFETVDRILQGQDSEKVSPLQSTFKQYVKEELDAVQSIEHKQYWQRQLQGFSRVKLPQWQESKPRPPEMKIRDVEISISLLQAVQALAQRTLIPVKSWLLAVHMQILKTLTNQQDITTGVLFHGRLEQKDGDRALGLFLNTLPFRMQLNGGTWAQIAEKAWETEKEMLQYRRYPMAQIQQDAGGGKLFETFFNFTHFYVSEQKINSYAKLRIREELGFADNSFPFGVEFSLEGENPELILRLRWDQALFTEAQMERIAGYYQNALAGIAYHSHEVADQFSLLPDRELHEIAQWNQTSRHFPETHLIHELFEQQAERTPDQMALIYKEHRLTYRQCNEEANRIAHYLRKQNIGPDVKVGICLERSVEMVTALLGILKAGGAYVPIHPLHPMAHNRGLIHDAELELVITSEEWTSLFNDYEGTVLYMEQIGQDLAVEPVENVNAPAHPEQLAYMIYTSGSTGKPKGVLIEHKAIANRLLWMQNKYRLNESDRVLQKTPFTFDVSVWEFFWPLLAGAALVIAEPEGHKDPEYLARLIGEERITTIHFVPSMLYAFLSQAGVEQCTSLRRVICSGEALSPALKQLFFEKLSCELHNLYGPTEAAVDVTSWECKREDTQVPIGYPIANIYIRLLNEQMQPVPVGVPGELYIGGVGLARGYHNRPELTAERFIADPFSKDPHARLYKTGDEARYLPGGAIEYIGRLDHQVKIRGHRVELGEIEARLAEFPEVRECVVQTMEDLHQHLQLVAYIVKKQPDIQISVKQLYDFLRERIPEYMIPARWMFIEELPLTASGKADRKALPCPDVSSFAQQDAEYQAPRDDLEQKLAAIWEKVLHISAPGIRDSFFHLGGSSLHAVQLMASVEREFARKLPLSTILENDTIERLAELLRNKQESEQKPSALVTLRSSGFQPPLFCIHPVGGSVICYNAFPEALGEDWPMYAIQAEHRMGERPPSSIKEMAKQYIRLIRTVQPAGPYSLLGWSFGGVVAHEMACQLRMEGEAVAILALLDARLKSPDEGEPELSEEEWKDYFLNDLAAVQLMGRDTVDKEAWDQGEEGLSHFYSLFKSNYKAMLKHAPQWFDGTLTWFGAKEEEADFATDNVWSSHARQVDSIMLEGDHYSIMNAANVQRIAAYLKSYNPEVKESV